MRIAITSTGTTLDSDMDPRFGRAQYILIVNDDGTIAEAIDNATNRGAMQGAGIQAGRLLSEKKVDVLLTGHCGPNAFKALDAAGIKVCVGLQGSVKDVLQRFNNNELNFSASPNVEAHW
jgi:predicted Fe-Mo cluster-binding NifX family protein